MLALVDGVPRTLPLDGFVTHWIAHQIDVIRRRTQFRLRKAEERAHILLGLLKALDRLDEVIALIRRSPDVEGARRGLMDLLDIDELQATAILDMQLRRLAALERQKISDEYDELTRLIADYRDILANEARQRLIVSEELAEIAQKHGDERRSTLVPGEGLTTDEDLIPVQDMVVTITADGYAKRTAVDSYRSQRRGGRGVKGAQLRQDDVVAHFFVGSTHDYVLVVTNKGRAYRTKVYMLPELGRDARGQHVANMLAFGPDESIATVLRLADYEQADHLVLATRKGLVKKTPLADYDTNRLGGLIGINLRDDDEVIGACLVNQTDDLLLVSTKGMSVRFHADDTTLRPMGRATSGVIGMRFRAGDSLLAMDVVRPGAAVVTVTDGGYAKRTSVEEWTAKGRGIYGVRAMRLVQDRGNLVGALVCDPEDEIFAIASNGVVIRTRVAEVRATGRDTMGVALMDLRDDDIIVAVARAAEIDSSADDNDEVGEGPVTEQEDGVVPTAAPDSGEGEVT
ncbi:MAG: DNA gyrase subunit A, partial [Actinobacteria bacterium]|nr:DNA gyrase subunit A [Actinomycetota bacterium]